MTDSRSRPESVRSKSNQNKSSLDPQHQFSPQLLLEDVEVGRDTDLYALLAIVRTIVPLLHSHNIRLGVRSQKVLQLVPVLVILWSLNGLNTIPQLRFEKEALDSTEM